VYGEFSQGERVVFVSVRRFVIAASTILPLALLAAPAAQADLVSLSACNTNALNQSFLRWGDPSYYELAPGGTFADSSWSLSGGAARVPGAEPYAASGSLSSSSLSLPGGSSADSPATCVNAAYPTIRFFVSGWGVIAVSVVYGNLVIPSGVVLGTGAWAPSPVTITGSAIAGALSGGTAQVSLRFTSVLGSPKVSDVFIDPWGRH
jgi:hypothetical protein